MTPGQFVDALLAAKKSHEGLEIQVILSRRDFGGRAFLTLPAGLDAKDVPVALHGLREDLQASTARVVARRSS